MRHIRDIRTRKCLHVTLMILRRLGKLSIVNIWNVWFKLRLYTDVYSSDQHELRVTGTKCRLPDTMSGTVKIFISGAVTIIIVDLFQKAGQRF